MIGQSAGVFAKARVYLVCYPKDVRWIRTSGRRTTELSSEAAYCPPLVYFAYRYGVGCLLVESVEMLSTESDGTVQPGAFG